MQDAQRKRKLCVSSKRWRGSDAQQRARDILDAIQAIRSYTKGMSRSRYLSDRKTQSAVERELLTIAEACGKLLDMDASLERRFLHIPWLAIRGMGNVIRHEYGRVEPEIVWDTITGNDLDALAQAVQIL